MDKNIEVPGGKVYSATPFLMERHIPKPKAVLFDFDDTLMHSVKLFKPVVRRVEEEIKKQLNGHGAPEMPSSERMESGSVQDYIRYYFNHADYQDGKRPDNTEIEEYVGHYFELFTKTAIEETERLFASDSPPTLFKGGVDTLRALIKEGVPIGIVTNSPQRLVDYSIPRLFPKDVLDKLIWVGTECNDRGKPSTDTMERALEKMKISPDHQVYYIGDSHHHDLKAAHDLGMSTVLFSTKSDDAMRAQFHNNPDAVGQHQHRYFFADNHQDLQRFFTRALHQEAQQAIAR